MYLKFKHTLNVIKNTIHREKCLQPNKIILDFTKRVLYLMYVTKKISFCLKKKRGGGWFIEPQIGDLSWKGFLRPESGKRGVFQSGIREHGCTFWSWAGNGFILLKTLILFDKSRHFLGITRQLKYFSINTTFVKFSLIITHFSLDKMVHVTPSN